MRKRTRYDIYMDTLETIRRKGVSTITRLSYGANLPVDRAKDVVSYLLERGLVEEEDQGSTLRYSITARGGEFIHALQTVKTYLDLRVSGLDPD